MAGISGAVKGELSWRQNAGLEFLKSVDAAARLLSGKFCYALLTTAEGSRS
jgi:hypothetical protein